MKLLVCLLLVGMAVGMEQKPVADQVAVESKGEASVTSIQAANNDDADKKNDGAEEFRSILQSLIDKELARGVDPVTAVHNINKAGIFVNAELVPANDPQEQSPIIKQKYQQILQKMLDEELKKGVSPLTALSNIQKSGALANTRIVPLNTDQDDTFIVIPAGKPFNRYAYRPIFDSPAPAFYKPANYYPEVSPYVRRPAYQQDQYYVRNYYNAEPVMRRPTFYAADQEQRPYSRPVYYERPTFRRTYNPEQYFRQGSFEAYPVGQTERFYPEQVYDMIEPAQSAPRPYSPRPFIPARPQFVPDQF